MRRHGKWLLNKRTLANLFVVVVGILVYLALSNFGEVSARVATFVNIINPFIIGFAIAYLLNRPVNFFERKLFSKCRMKRGLSIFVVYMLAFLLLCALLGLVLPQVGQSLVALANNISLYLENFTGYIHALAEKLHLSPQTTKPFLISYTDLVNRLTELVTQGLPQLLNMSVRIGSGVVNALTALISSIYMLTSKDTLVRQFRKLVYAFSPRPKATRFLSICAHANEVFSGFIVGKILDSAIIGVICFVGMNLLRLPYAMLISVIIGVTNIIPFFGPFIGAIPSIMILMIVDPWGAVWFGIFVLLLQQFDGNILGPKILGDSTGLSAIWVLVAIIVGGGLFGFPGMVLGVPSFAVLYALGSEFVAARLREKRIDPEGNPVPPAPVVEEPPHEMDP